jgi:hypothetical protein
MAVIGGLHQGHPNSELIVEQDIKNIIFPFYTESILPFYDREEEPPAISTITATWADGLGKLWCTDKMSVRESVMGYDAVGGGGTSACDTLYRHNVQPERGEASKWPDSF